MQTPYFTFNPRVLVKNYREFHALCQRYLDKFIIAYSAKTNTLKPVLYTLLKQGSLFEVASFEEIRKIPKTRLIFNSPAKTEKELAIALRRKFLINADSISEIDKIAKLLKGKKFNIGLRVSLEESKFGVQEEKIIETIDYAKAKNLNIVSLHFHSGTQLSLSKYKENIKKIEEIIKELPIKLKYINLGGGFPDKYQLKNLNASLEDFFKEIQSLKKFNAIIILEPGRCLVADSMQLITRVIAIKENFNKKYAILDAGINLLPKIALSQYPCKKMERKGKLKPQETAGVLGKEYIFAGPLLFGNDIIGKYQGELKEGNVINIKNVGAYCYNLAWEISYKKPKVFIERTP